MISSRKLKYMVLSFAVFAMALFVVGTVPVQASGEEKLSICSFVPALCDALGIKEAVVGEGDASASSIAYSFVQNRLQMVISVVFVAIILIAVFIIIQAAIKYIQSQGEEGKIQEAQKAIKNVFLGIAVLFVGIIGIVLVLAFFGGAGLLGTDQCQDTIFFPDQRSCDAAGCSWTEDAGCCCPENGGGGGNISYSQTGSPAPGGG